MNYSNKLFVSLIALLSINASGMQILRDRTAFRVLDGNTERLIQSYNTSKFLRGLSEEQLKKFENVGNRYKAIKLSNGEYEIAEEGGLKGGGPVSAGIAYGVVKGLCWTGLIGAGVGAVVATGGAALGAAGAIGGTAAAAGTMAGAIATTAGATAATATAATLGAAGGVLAGGAIAGAAIGATVATSTAVVATAAVAAPQVVATVAAVGGIAGGIEAASLAAFAFFLALPLP